MGATIQGIEKLLESRARAQSDNEWKELETALITWSEKYDMGYVQVRRPDSSRAPHSLTLRLPDQEGDLTGEEFSEFFKKFANDWKKNRRHHLFSKMTEDLLDKADLLGTTDE